MKNGWNSTFSASRVRWDAWRTDKHEMADGAFDLRRVFWLWISTYFRGGGEECKPFTQLCPCGDKERAEIIFYDMAVLHESFRSYATCQIYFVRRARTHARGSL